MSQVPEGARALVLTVSDRASQGVYDDRSGPLAADLLRDCGFDVEPVVVVPDEVQQIVAAIHRALDDGIDLVVTTGGTGFSPRDVTPEATAKVMEREAPGLAEAIRHRNAARVPTSILSRGLAGIAKTTLIVNLPGSSGGVRDGIAVLSPVVGHAIAQLRGGGDHER